MIIQKIQIELETWIWPFAENSKKVELKNVLVDYWRGPVTSEGVKGARGNLNIRAADGTETFVAGGKLEFSSSKQRSAILVAQGDVEHHQATPATKIRQWASAQAQALIDLSGDADTIKKKGFWIVTKTFTAKKCSISLLLSKESKSSYSVDAKAYGVQVSPSFQWWNSQKDSDWRDLSHVRFHSHSRPFRPAIGSTPQVSRLYSNLFYAGRWRGDVYVWYLVEIPLPERGNEGR